MATLKPVLSVREVPPAAFQLQQGLPSIRDFMGSEPRSFESELLDYLQQGITCGLSLDSGLSYDVIDRTKCIDKVSSGLTGDAKFSQGEVLTDGVWYWYAVLIYYVREYHIKVSSDFLIHASDKQWIIDCKKVDLRNLIWDDSIGNAALATR